MANNFDSISFFNEGENLKQRRLHYICPYEFLEIEISNPDQLKSEELLGISFWLEGEFRESRTIHYKGRKIGRKAAMKMIEVLKDPIMRDYTWRLYRLPALKNFLETGEARWFSRLEKEVKGEDPSFITFVSEFFTARYNDYLAGLINEGEFELAATVCRQREWLDPNDYYNAYQDARVFFWWRGKELEMKAKGFGLTTGNKRRYLDPAMLKCLSALADVYPQVSDFFAASLGEALVPTVNRRRDFALASEILLAAEQLPIKQDLATAFSTVRSQLKSAIATANPHEKIMIDLLPFKALRKGKWILWKDDSVKDQFLFWVYRVSLVFLISMVFWVLFDSVPNESAKTSRKVDFVTRVMGNQFLTGHLFRSLEAYQYGKIDGNPDAAYQTPHAIPYQDLIGGNPVDFRNSMRVLEIQNTGEKEAILFLLPNQRDAYDQKGIPHLYVPPGETRRLICESGQTYHPYVYRGTCWKENQVPFFEDAYAGAFTEKAEPPVLLLTRENEPVRILPGYFFGSGIQKITL